MTVAETEQLRKIARGTVSLETPIGEDGETELGHLIADTSAESPADLAAEADVKLQVEAALETLDARSRRVVQLRFGLTDGHQRTIEEVARRMGTNRESVRKLEREALRTLRVADRMVTLNS